MGEETISERVARFFRELFCKHYYVAALWELAVTIRCKKCGKAKAEYDYDKG